MLCLSRSSLGLFGRGRYLKEFMSDWPRRDEIYAELDAMDAELAKLRQGESGGVLEWKVNGKDKDRSKQ